MPKGKKLKPFIFLIIVALVVLSFVASLFNSKALENLTGVAFWALFIIFIIFGKKNPQKMKDFFEKISEIEKEGQQQAKKDSGFPTINIFPASAPTSLGEALNKLAQSQQQAQDVLPTETADVTPTSQAVTVSTPVLPMVFSGLFGLPTVKKLERNKKYLQVALNSSLGEARKIIRQLPVSDRIIIEAGTPLIKIYGAKAIREISLLAPNSYIVADSKTADLAEREVLMAKEAGASAITCLGVAPVETIDEFVAACDRNGLDSMIDMMNVESPLIILKKLKKLPRAVILHRGVDETEFNKEKMIPYYQINQIKGSFNVLLSVAGGDTPKEVQSAVFNGADIVVVWKNFMQAGAGVAALANSFLKEVK